ncbi:testis expressed protein 56-like isoform X2 [Talpa occidentalis]|uniref:testis expressed protein 56-like isoform X2 n=1 Tax=Talpa occidentalis TaxID=50954 RepID=UPI0018906992|nr:testis expressed protein 56-like isoform X2 [Talpa occidentalis]XP_054554000.1 testis expressed protein 56-like isoform X2 [Talpa occidentalis]
MGTIKKNHTVLKLPLLDTFNTPKNYDHPEVLRHTFETLSSLHKLLPNHLLEKLHSYKSEEDKRKCEDPELSGLERVLKRHEYPKEINLSPKPSSMPLWQRNIMNTANRSKCQKSTPNTPMSAIVVRWLKKNMQPTEDIESVTQKLSQFGPIQSVTLCGRQSAIVVYKNIVSASNAVNAFKSRVPGTMFQCFWKQPFMSRDIKC